MRVRCRRAGSSSSPALLEVLSVIREAWAEPRSLFDTRCTVTRMSYARQRSPPPPRPAMAARAPLAELAARPGASPGLLRRRYSVPETIMRKYRLAQQRSDSEDSGPATSPSPLSASPARGSPARRSALLRRLWGPAPACSCDGPRSLVTSLAGSHADLRPFAAPVSSSRVSSAPWGTPKRQRLDSTRDFRGSDEMIRAAMRNSYDRTEARLHRPELSDSTGPDRASFADPNAGQITDCDTPFDVRCERNGFAQYSDGTSDGPTPAEAESKSSETSAPREDFSFTDTSEAFSTSTTKETNGSVVCKRTSSSGHIDGRISERSVSVENDDKNLVPYDTPLTVETPSYDLLEIVVSETSNGSAAPVAKSGQHENGVTRISKAPPPNPRFVRNINIDEYVSNILVESLNSLTDQLEGMNASIGSDRKINIVEKEIKVKLQNTGVNTIVHLSPTSNNQIIFGNEELCNDGARDACNNPRDAPEAVTIREETASVESNNNEAARHDAVNHAVLQQIQKLFRDELGELDAAALYPPGDGPGVSHIEISNVDVYIDNNTSYGDTATIEMHTRNTSDLAELISGIGTGNYYEDPESGAIVPRFSAYPHTESMEVNTSSSEDADVGGSDCTSLVDSLDDPNSPRALLLRRARDRAPRRSDLVRSAIDVLDLLPEDAAGTDRTEHRDKGEAFFIRIKDDDCDCEKENVVVADHMPEKIKQRLYRRHRRRELRMECARRARPAHPRRAPPAPAPATADREARALLDALIDEYIAKIAHEEYKCMRIKQKPPRMVTSKSDENVSKRCRRDADGGARKEAFKLTREGSVEDPKDRFSEAKSERRHVRGKLSLMTHPVAPPADRGSKRIYQKSEIHDGNKCIEILEILEYVNGSQSSPETTNSDENHNHHACRGKKSRIPVPVSERIHRAFKSCSQKNYYGSTERINLPPAPAPRDEIKKSSRRAPASPPELSPEGEAGRRAPEPRSRSNSLRFRRVFDSIPEERSGPGVDSSNEDQNHNRRASAPNVIENLAYRSDRNGNGYRAPESDAGDGAPKKRSVETRSTGTSPPASLDVARLRSQTTMTSPRQRSAATSPPPATPVAPAAPARPLRRPPPGPKVTEVAVESVAARYERELASARAKLRDPPVGSPPPVDDSKSDGRPKSEGDSKTEGEPPKRKERARSESRYRRAADRKLHSVSIERNEEETVLRRSVKLPEFKPSGHGAAGAAGAVGAGGSSDSSDSGGSLLCSLAPRWLAHAHRPRRPRRRDPPASSAVAAPTDPANTPVQPDNGPRAEVTGGWSVTVAGSCRAALPADLEMRLRFPNKRQRPPRTPHHREHSSDQECWCGSCRRACGCGCVSPPARPRGPLAAPHPPHPPPPAGKLTLTMKKEATDSSILASKSMKKSADPLPDLETYKASRSKTKSSVKAVVSDAAGVLPALLAARRRARPTPDE